MGGGPSRIKISLTSVYLPQSGLSQASCGVVIPTSNELRVVVNVITLQIVQFICVDLAVETTREQDARSLKGQAGEARVISNTRAASHSSM